MSPGDSVVWLRSFVMSYYSYWEPFFLSQKLSLSSSLPSYSPCLFPPVSLIKTHLFLFYYHPWDSSSLHPSFNKKPHSFHQSHRRPFIPSCFSRWRNTARLIVDRSQLKKTHAHIRRIFKTSHHTLLLQNMFISLHLHLPAIAKVTFNKWNQ